MNKNKLLIITLSILLLILGLLATIPVLKKRVLQKSISPNILLITQPVISFSGIVEKIEGNIVTITQKVIEQSQIAPPLAPINNPQTTNKTPPSPFPTPVTKTVTYNVLITEKTIILQPSPSINYLFISPTPAPQTKLSTQDIKKGQTISVNTNVDLRILSGNEFEATMINLPQITNTLNGKIVGLEGNILTVKGFAPMMAIAVTANSAPVAPKEKEYHITLTSDTEISRMNNQGKPEKLTLTDLKKDMQVTIYTAEDVITSQNLTALRIEPMIVPVMPAALPSSLPSPATASPSGANNVNP